MNYVPEEYKLKPVRMERSNNSFYNPVVNDQSNNNRKQHSNFNSTNNHNDSRPSTSNSTTLEAFNVPLHQPNHSHQIDSSSMVSNQISSGVNKFTTPHQQFQSYNNGVTTAPYIMNRRRSSKETQLDRVEEIDYASSSSDYDEFNDYNQEENRNKIEENLIYTEGNKWESNRIDSNNSDLKNDSWNRMRSRSLEQEFGIVRVDEKSRTASQGRELNQSDNSNDYTGTSSILSSQNHTLPLRSNSIKLSRSRELSSAEIAQHHFRLAQKHLAAAQRIALEAANHNQSTSNQSSSLGSATGSSSNSFLDSRFDDSDDSDDQESVLPSNKKFKNHTTHQNNKSNSQFTSSSTKSNSNNFSASTTRPPLPPLPIRAIREPLPSAPPRSLKNPCRNLPLPPTQSGSSRSENKNLNQLEIREEIFPTLTISNPTSTYSSISPSSPIKSLDSLDRVILEKKEDDFPKFIPRPLNLRPSALAISSFSNTQSNSSQQSQSQPRSRSYRVPPPIISPDLQLVIEKSQSQFHLTQLQVEASPTSSSSNSNNNSPLLPPPSPSYSYYTYNSKLTPPPSPSAFPSPPPTSSSNATTFNGTSNGFRNSSLSLEETNTPGYEFNGDRKSLSPFGSIIPSSRTELQPNLNSTSRSNSISTFTTASGSTNTSRSSTPDSFNTSSQPSIQSNSSPAKLQKPKNNSNSSGGSKFSIFSRKKSSTSPSKYNITSPLPLKPSSPINLLTPSSKSIASNSLISINPVLERTTSSLSNISISTIHSDSLSISMKPKVRFLPSSPSPSKSNSNKSGSSTGSGGSGSQKEYTELEKINLAKKREEVRKALQASFKMMM